MNVPSNDLDDVKEESLKKRKRDQMKKMTKMKMNDRGYMKEERKKGALLILTLEDGMKHREWTLMIKEIKELYQDHILVPKKVLKMVQVH